MGEQAAKVCNASRSFGPIFFGKLIKGVTERGAALEFFVLTWSEASSSGRLYPAFVGIGLAPSPRSSICRANYKCRKSEQQRLGFWRRLFPAGCSLTKLTVNNP